MNKIPVDKQNELDLAVDEIALTMLNLGLTASEIREEIEYQAARVYEDLS